MARAGAGGEDLKIQDALGPKAPQESLPGSQSPAPAETGTSCQHFLSRALLPGVGQSEPPEHGPALGPYLPQPYATQGPRAHLHASIQHVHPTSQLQAAQGLVCPATCTSHMHTHR